MLSHCLQKLSVIAVVFSTALPGLDGSVPQGEVRVRDDQAGVNSQFSAQPLTLRAGPVGAVEGKGARLDLRQTDSTMDTGKVLREKQVFRRLG
jgi:hypothetical protein